MTQFFFYQVAEWLHGILVLGMYKPGLVISGMLPLMASFPLLSLEDLGYLPRLPSIWIIFKKACPWQAGLNHVYGVGCNAAG